MLKCLRTGFASLRLPKLTVATLVATYNVYAVCLQLEADTGMMWSWQVSDVMNNVMFCSNTWHSVFLALTKCSNSGG